MKAATLVWVVLMLATILSWWLGADHGLGPKASTSLLTVAILIVAFFKVRLVMLYFMEVRHAPASLRWLSEGWILLAGGSVISAYLLQ